MDRIKCLGVRMVLMSDHDVGLEPLDLPATIGRSGPKSSVE